jgi:hypothetical protein
MARIVVNTYMVRYPLGGNLSWALQWVIGLERLGHDVYIVEKGDYPNACFDLPRGLMTDDCTYGVATVRALLTRFGLQDSWCYVDANGGYHGLSRQRVEALVSSADLFLDMGAHGLGMEGTWLHEAANAGLRVLVATEPGLTQMRMELKLAAGEALPQYDVYYTTGLNVGTAASPAPTAGRHWRTIVDPVVVDLFACHPRPPRAAFSTVMNWQSMPPVIFDGVRYGQKDLELPKFIDLPRRTRVPLELAIAGKNAPIEQLRAAGWRSVTPFRSPPRSTDTSPTSRARKGNSECASTRVSRPIPAGLASAAPRTWPAADRSSCKTPASVAICRVGAVSSPCAPWRRPPPPSMRSTPTGSAMRAGAGTWHASIWTPRTVLGNMLQELAL